MWHYFTPQINQAVCNICDRSFCLESNSQLCIQIHLASKHNTQFEMETDFIPCFTIKIQNHEVKCNICPPTSPTTYKCTFTITPEVTDHLDEHQIDESKAKLLQVWLSNHFSDLSTVNVKPTCKYCYYMFENINSFTLMKHLINAHQTKPPSQFIPKG